jgi:hypothetical protein
MRKSHWLAKHYPTDVFEGDTADGWPGSKEMHSHRRTLLLLLAVEA